MTNWKELCAELLEALENAIRVVYHEDGTKHISTADPVIAKADAALAQPEPEGLPPRVGHILRLAEIIREVDGNHGKGAAALAEAILSHPGSRWSPTIEPVPVAERLPGAEDCITNPRTGQGQWCWGWVQHDEPPYSGRWRMMRREWLRGEAAAWLPHWALPVPSSPTNE